MGRRFVKLEGVRSHNTDRLDRADVSRLGVIPITRVDRTLLDLCAAAPELANGALEDALLRRMTSVASLLRTLERLGGNGRRGTALLRRVLKERGGGEKPTESFLEDEFVALLRRHRVRQPVRQHWVVLRRRDRSLVALGWTVLRYDADDIRTRGAEVIEEIAGLRQSLLRRRTG